MPTATHDTTAPKPPRPLSPTQQRALQLVDEYAPMRVEPADLAWVADIQEAWASQNLYELWRRGLLERERSPAGTYAYRRKA